MVDGRLVKCNYCGTKILLRFQMGYFDIPFDICCPKCKGRINGIRKIVDEHKFEINGAKDQECRTEDIDFFADFSVELPHRKITKYESINSLISSGFSPFMMAMQIMGHDDYEKYTQQIGRFIGFKSKLFPRISAFYSMYFNGNIEYLQSPLLKISEAYVIKNLLDASMSLHQLLVIHLNTILPDVSFKEFTDCSQAILRMVRSGSFSSVDNLITLLGGKEYFNRETKKILNITSDLCDMFEAFIPVVMLCLSDKRDSIDKNTYGISTVSFSKLKTFYANTYELILELIDIPVALNNLQHRGNIDEFPDSSEFKDFKRFRNLTKGKKAKALCDGEVFTKPIHIDRNVRNAIDHFDYEYDVTSQKITFRDKYNGEENNVEMYLLDLAYLCYDNIIILSYLNELLYNLQKIDYTKDGLMPHIGPIKSLNLEET